MPWADILYGCDERWWDVHEGTDFAGEKWSTHGAESHSNDKRAAAEKYGLNLVKGCLASSEGFSTDPEIIHYGNNSGYQSINLATLLGSDYIVLVGFNMSRPGGKGHFFGDHPEPLHNQPDYEKWLNEFNRAAKDHPGIIINATPQSALECWHKMTLEDAIEHHHLYRHWAESDEGASAGSPRDWLSTVRLQQCDPTGA